MNDSANSSQDNSAVTTFRLYNNDLGEVNLDSEIFKITTILSYSVGVWEWNARPEINIYRRFQIWVDNFAKSLFKISIL